MVLESVDLSEVVERLKSNKENKIPTAILIGAGVSVSGGIPLANEMVAQLKEKYPEQMLSCNDYNECMNELDEIPRKEFLKDCCEKGKVNQSYLYLSVLIKEGYIDKVLTANFDNLVLQAMAYENLFPGVYDMPAIGYYRPEMTAKNAVFFLHGQKDGYTLLNTPEEFERYDGCLEPLFKDILSNYTLIVIGYSGANDRLLDFLSNSDFPNHLYWIAYTNEQPNENIIRTVLTGKKNAHFLNDCNSDEFFGNLTLQLGTGAPQILYNTFSWLYKMLNELSNAQTSNGRNLDMAEIQKKFVRLCISIFEEKQDPIRLFNEKKEELDFDISIREVLNKWSIHDPICMEMIEHISKSHYSAEYVSTLKNAIFHSFAVIDMANQNFQAAVEKFEHIENPYMNDTVFCANYASALYSLFRHSNDRERESHISKAIFLITRAIELGANDFKNNTHLGIYCLELAALKTTNDRVGQLHKALSSFECALRFKSENTLVKLCIDTCLCLFEFYSSYREVMKYWEKSLVYLENYIETDGDMQETWEQAIHAISFHEATSNKDIIPKVIAALKSKPEIVENIIRDAQQNNNVMQFCKKYQLCN